MVYQMFRKFLESRFAEVQGEKGNPCGVYECLFCRRAAVRCMCCDNVEEFWNVINRISHSRTKILISDVVRPDNELDVLKIVKDVLGEDSVFEKRKQLMEL